MSEMDFVNSIIDYLLRLGFCAWRTNAGNIPVEGQNGKKRLIRLLPKGFSDVLFIPTKGKHRGRFGVIEAKQGSNEPTPDQLAFLQSVQEAGGLAYVVWSMEELEYLFLRDGLIHEPVYLSEQQRMTCVLELSTKSLRKRGRR